ncbi:MAG: 16S rRNA (cytosine(1402)-N(4))-methyltransferase RsmH [Patescibacteria group bacterium]
MKDTHQKNQIKHIPVLLEPVLSYLDLKEGESYLDLTAGYGGHAGQILGRTLGYNHAFLVDRDQSAIDFLQTKFAGRGVTLLHQDFYLAAKKLLDEGHRFDIILADLGVSSPHLEDASRGFSFQSDGSLDMRMDQNQDLDAEKLINNNSVEELEKIIRVFGEEPRAKKISLAIVQNRPVMSTKQLAEIILNAIGGKRQKTHPATKTFQALRIAVNSELELLTNALPIWIELLKPGGRIAVISFHSLEDRLVKQAFSEVSGNRYDASLQLLTKSPIVAVAEEIAFNPRSRSAKLRVAVKK